MLNSGFDTSLFLSAFSSFACLEIENEKYSVKQIWILYECSLEIEGKCILIRSDRNVFDIVISLHYMLYN